MEYRQLGRTGVRVSPLCLGAMNFGECTEEPEANRIIHKALDAGINFIDTSNSYGDGESERMLGKALANGKREMIVLSSKFYFPQSEDPNDQGNSRRHVMQALEDSLRRLNTDWIDLYQIHRPSMDIPQDETLRALDDLVHQGKVRYIGCTTYPTWMVMEALAISEQHNLARFITVQPPYNFLDRRIENELVPLALRYNLGLITWSPIGMGILAGRYQSVDLTPEGSRLGGGGPFVKGRLTPKSLLAFEKFAEVAQDLEITPSQLALLWVKDQPAIVAPIIGPRTEAHLEDALPVMDMHLDPETAGKLDQIVPPGSAVSDFHNSSRWSKMKLDF
ncbi:MAG: aldo/keto reductase [Chloroflexi bacterium RBG_16_48_8]|nr:MAG: aldo/keto reductase [Chloroflexi bacterium RBG_16_48_8]